MALSFFGSLAASRRLGKATRLHKKGAYEDALVLLLENRTKLASASAGSVSSLSVRLMNLVHLAEVATALRRPDLVKDALQEWLLIWDAARTDVPGLAKVDLLTKWKAGSDRPSPRPSRGLNESIRDDQPNSRWHDDHVLLRLTPAGGPRAGSPARRWPGRRRAWRSGALTRRR